MIRIGKFVFDPRCGTLSSAINSQDPKLRKLEPQISELLLFFASHPQQLLSRDTIADHLWPGRVVTDDALRAAIKKLREALQDNARDPQYIKTLPLKGYTLIAPVSAEQPANKQKAARGHVLWACAALSLVLLTTGIWQVRHLASESEQSLNVHYLTQMSGSEVIPDYDPVNHRLLFSHRANKDDYLQLYVKDLDSGLTTRLTSEQVNYASGLWAPDRKTLIYTRSDINSQIHYLADYDPEQGIVHSRALDNVINDMYLLSWANNQQAVYLKDKFEAGQPQGIWRLHLKNNKLENITAPSSTGQGDIFAQESHDGEFLAILRHIGENRGELLILHLATGELVNTFNLPYSMDRLVWSPDDKLLTMSNFAGKLLQYHNQDKQVREIPHKQPYLNHIFYQCAADCFYMRQHSGNYLDLGEQVNPFSENPLQSSNYFESAGAEDFPVYGPKTHKLYFVSRDQGVLTIELLDSDKNTQLVAQFPEDLQVTALAINPQETMLAGLADNRVFTAEIDSGELRFITNAIDKNYPPLWTADGDALVYARFEKNRPVLYRYNLKDKQHVRKQSGYLARANIDKQREIMVDQDLNAYLLETDRPPRLLTRLPAVTPNRWRVSGDWLYYTEHKENLAFIHRVNLHTGQKEAKQLAKNRFRLSFDIHHNEKTMAIVRSRLADSNLVEVRL